MCRRSIIDYVRGVGEFLELYARRGEIKGAAGSSGRICELEFGYAMLCVISDTI